MLTDPKTIYYSLTLPSPNQHSWCKIDLKITQPNTYTSINILLQLLPSRHCTDEIMLSFSAAHIINLALSHQQVLFFFSYFFFLKNLTVNTTNISSVTQLLTLATILSSSEKMSTTLDSKAILGRHSNTKTGKKGQLSCTEFLDGLWASVKLKEYIYSFMYLL